jgi:hypothetical protein
VDVFVEECVVRRELADNFCHYNPLYDSLDGCNDWAKEVGDDLSPPHSNILERLSQRLLTQTLRVHSSDPRPIQYTLAQVMEQTGIYHRLAKGTVMLPLFSISIARTARRGQNP